jgi:DNA-binding MarR family transcriptional regulator
MQSDYLEIIALTERLHRRFLEVLQIELDKLGARDINNVQALMLYNIGELEMTVGELTTRGCYLGANVSYNVKTMLEGGYIVQHRSSHDRRAVYVRLSSKGLALHKHLQHMHKRHVSALGEGLSETDLVAAQHTLRRLERFWSHALDFGARGLAILQPPLDVRSESLAARSTVPPVRVM